MKKFCLCLSVLLISIGRSVAQTPAPTHHSNSEEIDSILARLEPRILAVADAMPAEKYGFVPTAGEFAGVRSFAEQLKHIAADNYLDGAAVSGDKAPPGNLGPAESGSSVVRTKPEVIAYVKDSFEYVRRAARRIDDQNRAIPNPAFLPYGPSVTSSLHIMLANIGHTMDHYGQLVEYLRMNGIVPPESRPKRDVGQALDFWISNTEREVVSAGDAMPEGRYSFTPAAGEFQGVRTFAEQVKHLAANNYRMAAYILDQTPAPDQESESGPGEVRTKAQTMEYLRGSFVALHRAVATINTDNEVIPTSRGSATQNTRLQFAVDAVAHSYDHYGQMVEYLRMNGIVPPASRASH